MNGGDYERWVTGLRAWRDDPGTDLSGLPVLTSASFTPATFDRLFSHVQAALQAVMDGWNRRLNAVLESAAGDPHLIGRALVGMRAELGRRLQFARHASWPAEIRAELEAGAERDIRHLQAQLERNVAQQQGRTGSDRATVELMLRIVRENRLTAILDPGFDLERLFAPAGVAPEPSKRITVSDASHSGDLRTAEGPGQPAGSRPVRRIVVDS